MLYFLGLKTIVGAVIESVKNLKDVIILTLFSLSVFALVGLQIYMGVLTQKCILDLPSDVNYTDDLFIQHASNECENYPGISAEPQPYSVSKIIHVASFHWFVANWETDGGIPILCGNSSGAGWVIHLVALFKHPKTLLVFLNPLKILIRTCKENYTCHQGFGENPNHGFTNFDSFGWALLSAFRLMTQDAWEALYQQVGVSR